MNALIAKARFHYHERLFETNTLTLTKAGIASNADTSSRGSKAIAGKIVDILVDEYHHTVNTIDKISGQTLGTGDIDCVYHFALYELVRAVKEVGSEDAAETLETLVQGKRLKDISDLPLDLAV